MPATNRSPTSGGPFAGRGRAAASRIVPAPFVGRLALGFGLLLLGAAHLDHHADDRVSQHVEPVTHDVDELTRVANLDRHLDLAQRLRLDRALDFAFWRKLTC